MNTTEVTFTLAPYEEAVADALMAALGDLGYDGFTYTDDGFAAYIPAARFDAGQLERSEALAYFANQYAIRWTVREIEDRDWNKEWEDHFTPIVVDNRIQVRAGFHEPLPGMEYEIIIEPLDEYIAGGFISHTGTKYAFTVKGMYVSNYILSSMLFDHGFVLVA